MCYNKETEALNRLIRMLTEAAEITKALPDGSAKYNLFTGGNVIMGMMDLMRQRHSVRQYTDRAIEPEKRETLTALAQQFNRETGKGFSGWTWAS